MRAAAARALRHAAAARRHPQPPVAIRTRTPLDGARRHLRRPEREPHGVQVARATSSATEPAWRGQALKQAEASADAVHAGSPGLDTRNGRVILPGNDLTSLRASTDADVSLRGLPTTLLNDGRSGPRSAAELEQIREGIIEYFHKTFSISERLHEMFTTASALYEKHERLRHPPIFYLGHTASFYINKLQLGKYITERIDPVLEMQMAVGVDEMSWDDLDSNSYVWPSGAEARADPERAAAFLQKVLNFRREVRLLVDRVIRTQPMEFPIGKDSFWYVILMGIEHERIHLETSSVIHRQADLDCIRPSAMFPLCEHGRFHKKSTSAAAESMPPNRLVPIEKGTTRLGRPWEGTKTYGWDSEFGDVSHLEVPSFVASEFLVSNKEFLDFVEAGGYSTSRFWSTEGWNWVSDMKPEAPRFWRRSGDDFHLRTLCHEVPMPWDWPVEVCHHEAAAFCKFLSEKTGKSLRLPMEDEYLRMRDSVPTDLQDSEHGPAWGEKTPGNVNLAYWASSCPVDMFQSPSGVYDVLGNVWQHCATNIDVLDGFETHPLYEDFTTPTVGALHSRIMGGSWISTGCSGAARDSRYGFRRHFYQHAGFRYIESGREVVNRASPYEQDYQLCNAFRFHFDEPAFGECFHVGLAKACVDTMRKLGRPVETARVLELGCGPGRTVLELAKRGFAAAHGGDRTAKAFQCTAQRVMVDGGRLRWTNYLEGEHVAKRELDAAELGLGSSVQAEAVQFFQLPDFAAVDTQKFHDYDVVVCAQPGALGRSDPLGTLAAVHGLLKPGGLLVIGTQYEWPRSTAASATTPAATSGEEEIAASLRPWFKPAVESVDLAYVRMETARTLECGLQHLTFWERRAAPEPGANVATPAASAGTAPLSPPSKGQSMCEEDLAVGQHLDLRCSSETECPSACAQLCIATARTSGVPLGRALQVGGGLERDASELSTVFGHVDSCDLSRCIAGRTMERQALPKELTGYDLIYASKIIDRLAQPEDFLSQAESRLNPGGLLVISSAYTWLEEFTAKEHWIGGFKYGDNDGPSTYEGLKELLLSRGFVEARAPEEVCFRVAELDNGRRSRQTLAQLTFWKLLGR